MNLPTNTLAIASSSSAAPSSLIVINAVTANLFKDRNGGLSYYSARIGKNWNFQNSTALEFVSIIQRKFSKNNKFHGFFDPDSPHMAPRTIERFVDAKIDFNEMVKLFVDSACDEANEPGRGALTLGHLVFVHYKTQDDEDNAGRFLAVLLGDQGAFDFDKDLQPIDLNSINTNELRHAAMFDLTLFKATYPKNDGEAYLKFITGKSKSAFLKDAFGCEDYVPNKYSIEQVSKAVLDFLEDPTIPGERRLKILEGVASHLEVAAKKQIAVSIEEIQNVINRQLPLNSRKINGFTEFVNLGDYTISDRFQPTRQNASGLRKVEIEDPDGNFRCNVALGAIGFGDIDDGKTIKVDYKFEKITFPLTPYAQAIIKQILDDQEKNLTPESGSTSTAE
ncbi:nucleoid-associated protein [Pseudomonas asplenii]|uniref:nucleoid-associated protein n=1 Tax=Pseudomonas asplenii TaxID=53407 RepID=UPI0022349482|nr:nucleoid-associated protein [Pseudomonas asplenii]UZE26656.1 nucleoid-associated protein [Pseudomonas asplenii]